MNRSQIDKKINDTFGENSPIITKIRNKELMTETIDYIDSQIEQENLEIKEDINTLKSDVNKNTNDLLSVDTKIEELTSTVQGSQGGIRKVYSSEAAMNADVSPKDDNGVSLTNGQLVSIVNETTPSENAIYKWKNPGWEKAGELGDLSSYAKNGGSEKTLKNLDDEIVQLAGTLKAYILPNIPISIYKTGVASTNAISFSANPVIQVGEPSGKRLSLFATSDDKVIQLGSNGIAYVDISVINSTPHNGNIGLANVQVSNWTTNPDLRGKVILCRIYNDFLEKGVGLIGEYLSIKQLYNVSQKISSYFSPTPSFDVVKIGSESTNAISFSANPVLVSGDNPAKRLSLFNSGDDKIIQLGSNGIAYVDVNYINSLPNLGNIGLANVQVSNWVTNPDLTDKIVLCRISNNELDPGVGLIGEYLVSKLGLNLKTVESDVKNILSVLNVFIAPYRPFNVSNTGGAGNKILFSANPMLHRTYPTEGRFNLFLADEAFELEMGANDVAYVSISDIIAVAHTGYLGSNKIKISNWTTNPDLTDKIVLLRTNNYAIEAGIGIVGYYLLGTQISSNKNDIMSIDSRVGVLENKIPSIRGMLPSQRFYESNKIKEFKDITLKRNRDAVVVLTGTSLTKGVSHCSERSDKSIRPPLLHTVDFASQLYDKLLERWDGQESRRYDNEFFTLIGSGWITTDTDLNWDDSPPAHNGVTKYTIAPNAGVSFVVPSTAYRFNFIYRTDALGDLCTVSIAQGDGKMEVLDESDETWKEANGFQFSMLESPATATKGNTVFQKRLNMRCKNRYDTGGINSIGEEKSITIKKGDNTDKRFLFVGAEWSRREFMLQVINAARGSHQWGAGGNLDNSKYQDSDIWAHNPNLLMAEITTINWGGSTGTNTNPEYYLNLLKRWYFNDFKDEPNSIAARTNDYTDCEVIFYNDTMSTQAFTGGELTWGNVAGEGEYKGVIKSAYENYDIIDSYVYKYKTDYIFIALNPNFKIISEKVFGSHYLGLVGSGKTGTTLTSDGTHWNDNGALLVASLILPIFDY